ncbi:hypothetical protein K1T71_008225 [Dendrolimus kikuchii]|uniref:Uncharacterized protein n=1 Tax=Dendrolimus kikuchii TaxID=765133 RepID=A0ACC1CWS5_9NEOP|nr:hypothetical protein K1T71_008225 [Dendrolimus kikuchii]
MRYCYKRRLLYCGIIIIVLVIILHLNNSSQRTYDYVEKENILNNLHEEIATNFTSSAIVDCDYYEIIHDESTFSLTLIDGDLVEGHNIREGGEYAPQDCKPKYSTAIIVPYRDRAEQLRGFLVYMHTFFHHQHIHYRIFVVEQVDSKTFNRAKLMNIGAIAAMKAGFPCFILHDVNLLPLRPGNLYACTQQPRHMSCSINKYRFIFPNIQIFEGAISILSKQFKAINGMSNELGVEEDDLYKRIKAKGLKLYEFDSEMSQYHLVTNKFEHKGDTQKGYLSRKKTMEEDGLSSLQYTEVATVLHPLFTHIMVDL